MEDRSLFGETGSKNSSVVNLLAEKEVSRTSPDIDGCTEACEPYSLFVNGASYTVCDTVGLDEPMAGDTGYLRSIVQPCQGLDQSRRSRSSTVLSPSGPYHHDHSEELRSVV